MHPLVATLNDVFTGPECGSFDQSAFTRQFQRVVGMTPGAHRDQLAAHR